MKIKIIEACSDLGVNIDGSSLGPVALEKYIDKNKCEIIRVKAEPCIKSKDPKDLAKNIKALNKFNNNLYKTIVNIENNGYFPITIGGDHSIAIASSLASIKKEEKLGIIWIDTHPDFNTFKTTTTGNIHGLPLATVTNNNGDALTKFHNGNFYKNENTVIIGARDIDPLEKVELEKANIKIFTTDDVKKHNVEEIIKQAISIATKNTNGIHISFDIDVMDPTIAPGVSVSFKNGINKEETFSLLNCLLNYKDMIKSFDIVEYNPSNDINQKTEKVTAEILKLLINTKK